VTARRKASGFTLIEIIVVVAIIAVAAAVAVPSINAGAPARFVARQVVMRCAGFVDSGVSQTAGRVAILAKEGVYTVVVPTASSGDEAAAATDDEQRGRRRSDLLGRANESTAQGRFQRAPRRASELGSFGTSKAVAIPGMRGSLTFILMAAERRRSVCSTWGATADSTLPSTGDQLDSMEDRVRSERFHVDEVLIATLGGAIGRCRSSCFPAVPDWRCVDRPNSGS
jgi:prepilin-type N-terminal cleavage/methylation domain-containing protein